MLKHTKKMGSTSPRPCTLALGAASPPQLPSEQTVWGVGSGCRALPSFLVWYLNKILTVCFDWKHWMYNNNKRKRVFATINFLNKCFKILFSYPIKAAYLHGNNSLAYIKDWKWHSSLKPSVRKLQNFIWVV